MFKKLATCLVAVIIINLMTFGLSTNVAKAATSTRTMLAQAVTDTSQIDATADVVEEGQVASWTVRLIGIGGFAILFVVGWLVARASHNRQLKSNKLKVTSYKRNGSKKSAQLKTKKTVQKTSRRPK